MAINAYSTGVTTGVPSSIDIKPDVAQGDMLYWNATLNLFETAPQRLIPVKTSDLTNDVPFTTQQYVVNAIANASIAGADVDLSIYDTITSVDSKIAGINNFDGLFSSLTSTPTTIAGYGITDAFDGDYNSLTNLPTLFSGNYNDLTNKPVVTAQTLVFDGETLSITNGNNVSLAGIRQTLSISGSVLTLSNGNSVTLPSGGGGGGGIALTSLSVGAEPTASGDGDVSYDNTTGIFTYTPPDLSGYATSAGLSTVATSGAYGDISGTPSIPADISDLTDTGSLLGSASLAMSDLTNVSTASPTSGQVLKWDGTEWAPASDSTGAGGAGIALTDISVGAEATASGNGAVSYNNVTGVITYTPPVIEAESPIGWSTSGASSQYRTTSTFTESGTQYTVRGATFDGDGQLQLELANFSPTVSATAQSLSWDVAATQFSVTVDNPADFTTRWINEVAEITGATGVHTTLSDYTTTGTSATPAGGVDWTQTFTTNATAVIVSNGTGLTGGAAGASIGYNDDQSASWTDINSITWNWQNANSTISFGTLTGKTFLESYPTVDYTVGITGLYTPSNAVTTVTSAGGAVSSTTGSGTFTFTDAIHKDNNTGRSVSASTVFTRPAAVTGTGYTATDTAQDTTISASFTYPSLYVFTASVGTVPVVGDIVSGSDFVAGVTQLGNQTKSIDTFITNSAAVPQGFWMAVRTSASQPTAFKTGISNALLSDVTPTTGSTVDLAPDSPAGDYTAEEYTLYGLTLQPGQTYVRIS